MKKYVVAIMSLTILISLTAIAGASDRIRLFVNGNEIYPDVPPQIIDGRTMVPIRAVSEALGAEVNWDTDNQSVNISLEADDMNKYNAFVAEAKSKISDFNKEKPTLINGASHEIYGKLQIISRTYEDLINKAMYIHPPKEKIEEHNKNIKKMITTKTSIDLVLSGLEKELNGDTKAAEILTLEAYKYLQ